MARRRFIASLSDSEQQALTSAYQHGEKRALRRRAHAILLSHQGHTINQISEILDTPKYILKKLMTGRLPQTIIDRKKMGFPVPLDSWLNQPKFREFASEILLDSSSVVQDFFNIDNVNAALSKNSIDSYYDYEGKRIWMLLQFELWHREYFSK